MFNWEVCVHFSFKVCLTMLFPCHLYLELISWWVISLRYLVSWCQLSLCASYYLSRFQLQHCLGVLILRTVLDYEILVGLLILRVNSVPLFAFLLLGRDVLSYLLINTHDIGLLFYILKSLNMNPCICTMCVFMSVLESKPLKQQK